MQISIENFLTFTIFIMGIITVVLSIYVSIKFAMYRKNLNNSAKDLSGAISWQLAGEAIIGFGTLIFSGAAFLGVLEHWSIMVQSSLRFVMFFATSATTLHLVKTLRKIN